MIKYQKWLIVSIVILIVALVMPIFVLFTALQSTLQTAVNTIPNFEANNPATAPINDFYQNQQGAQRNLLILVIGVEAVLVGAFAGTLLYAIRCRDRCRNFPPPT